MPSKVRLLGYLDRAVNNLQKLDEQLWQTYYSIYYDATLRVQVKLTVEGLKVRGISNKTQYELY